MNKFQVNECPLCGKILRFRQVSGVNLFDCATQVAWITDDGIKSRSHYEVEFDPRESIQRMYVLPYNVDNFQSDRKTRLYKLFPGTPEKGGDRWQLVMETPQIRPDVADKLLERIKTLMTYL